MTSLAFASFVRDAERNIDDPHAIAARLEQLLALDGWLAPGQLAELIEDAWRVSAPKRLVAAYDHGRATP